MPKDAAAIMAVQLASRPRQFFCPRIPVDPQITLGEPKLDNFADTAANHQNTGRLGTNDRNASAAHRGESSVSPWTDPGGVHTQVPSRPFLYSLLSSTPFASLFDPRDDAVNASQAGSHDIHNSDQDQPWYGKAAPTILPTGGRDTIGDRSGRKSIQIPRDDVEPLSPGLFSKVAIEPVAPDRLTVRSRSFMDLPSLLSASCKYP